MNELASDPYVVGRRDWWSMTWRIWLANRVIDSAVIFAVFWYFGDGNWREGFLPILGFVVGFGAYAVVRNWVAAFFTSTGDGSHYNIGFGLALRRMKIEPRAIQPARLDGLLYLLDADYKEPRDRVGAALLYGIAKGTSGRLPFYRQTAYEASLDNAILRYVLETRINESGESEASQAGD